MKLMLLLLSCLSLSLCAELHPGGTSFDFGKYPVRKNKRAAGENLLKNGDFSHHRTDLQGEGKHTTTRKGQYWDGCSYVHMSSTDGPGDAYRAAMQKFSFRKAVNNSAAVITDAAAAASWTKRMRVSNRVRQTVTLPESDLPRSFQLSFKLRGKAGRIETWNHPQIFISAGANPAGRGWKLLKTCVSKVLPFSRDFEEYAIEFTVPPKSRSIHVDFALYGIGEMYFGDVCLTPIVLSNSVDALNFPAGYFDKLFCVPSDQHIPILFALGCQGKPDRKKLRFELELPPHFYIRSYRPEHPLLSKKGNTYTFSLEKIHPSAITANFTTQWQAVSLLLQTSLSPSSKKFTARYRTAGADYTTPWKTLTLQVIPPISGKRPEKFLSGAMLSTDFNYASHRKEAVKLLADTGFNALINGNSGVKKAAEEFKFRRFSSLGMANGFRVIPGKLNENEKFRKIDGTAWENSVCPGAVIRRSESYQKNLLPLISKALAPQGDTDAVICNWEPYMYDFRGCFCQECMKEFARFAKIPLAESTPTFAISKYQAQWIKFRSMRHGGVVKQLHRDIAQLGAKHGKPNASFIPEMAYNSVLPSRKKHYAQYAVADYINEIPELNLWGPYIFHAPDHPYVYAPAPNLKSFTAWEQVLFHVSKMVRSKRPKLYTFPHGTLDAPVWFSHPEGTAFEFLATFVLGWEGAFGYYFPRGGDGRYYRALAQANTLIAEHETLRYAGKDISSSVQLRPATPCPKHNFFTEYPGLPNEFPGISKKSLLQYRAVEYKGTRLIMAGNFWISSEIFFHLKTAGLTPSALYEVTLPGVRLGTFTGKELARGILIQCGALRWQFITVKPAQKRVPPDISQKQMVQIMKKRLPAITEAARKCNAEYEKQRSASDKENAKTDLSAVQAVDSSGVKLSVNGERMTVSTALYTLQIDPRNGGRIVNWRSGKTLLFGEPGKLGFGVDGFWYPASAAKQLLRPYKVLGSAKISGGAAVTLRYTVSADFIPALAGLHLIKRYEFYNDRIKQTTTFVNETEHGMNFSFRFHAMPDFLSLRNEKSGSIDFGGVIFTREYFEKMFRFAPSDSAIEKAFTMHKVRQISRAAGVLSAPWSKLKLKSTFEKEKLQCIVCWDDLKDPAATFEAVFRRTSLHPGEKISYTQIYSIMQPN